MSGNKLKKAEAGESAVDMVDSVSVSSDRYDGYDREEDQRPRSSGFSKTIVNIINTIIGSGILGLPAALSEVGWLLGIVLLVFGGSTTLFGVHLLNKVAHRIGGTETSFGKASLRTYPFLIVAIDLCVAVTTWGITIAYLGIAADYLPKCVEQLAPSMSADNILRNSYFWLLLCWGVLAAPLSMLRSVGFLGWTSGIAVLAISYTTVIVALHFFGVFDPCSSVPDGEICQGNITPAIFEFTAIFRSLPIYLTAFCCAPTMFNLYNDMRNPSVKRMDIAASLGLTFAGVLYAFVAILGYLTYGDLVQGNVLNSYPITTPVTIARIGTAFVVIVSYPLLMHPARDSTVHAIQTIAGLATDLFKDPNNRANVILFYTVAAVLNIGSMLFALLRVDLTILLGLCGALGVSNLTFTIPAVFYWKMFDGATGIDGVKRMLCIPMMLFGLFVTGASMYANFF